MPFGKYYKDRRLDEVPLDYLGWLLTIDLRSRLRAAVEAEVPAADWLMSQARGLRA